MHNVCMRIFEEQNTGIHGPDLVQVIVTFAGSTLVHYYTRYRIPIYYIIYTSETVYRVHFEIPRRAHTLLPKKKKKI